VVDKEVKKQVMLISYIIYLLNPRRNDLEIYIEKKVLHQCRYGIN
jgi:hypothetical protein